VGIDVFDPGPFDQLVLEHARGREAMTGPRAALRSAAD
jgi:hypothetical protein